MMVNIYSSITQLNILGQNISLCRFTAKAVGGRTTRKIVPLSLVYLQLYMYIQLCVLLHAYLILINQIVILISVVTSHCFFSIDMYIIINKKPTSLGM